MTLKTKLAETTPENFEPISCEKQNEIDNETITENQSNNEAKNHSVINEKNNKNKKTKIELAQLGYTFDTQLRKKPGKILTEIDVLDIQETNGDTNEKDNFCDTNKIKNKAFYEFEMPLVWNNVIILGVFHFVAIYTLFTYPYSQHLKSLLWFAITILLGGFGVTGGAHRLWSHRSYKAKTPLRIILMLCFTLAGQNSIFHWVRDHRVHHKYSETNADPHNAKRGFFFSHVGWLMMKRHPEVIRKGKLIDMSDVLADPVVQFHEKYFASMSILICFFLPTAIPVFFWNESWYYSMLAQCFLRYVFVLNFTWLVNSVAHLWGNKPYDKRLNPSENKFVSLMTMGEGWHNYHHVFPWDYKAAELGDYGLNMTTFWLDLFSKIGWVYDMKHPSKELVRRVIEKHGDGSHPIWGKHVEEVEESHEDWKSLQNSLFFSE